MPAAEVEDFATALFDAAQSAPRILEDALPLLFEDAVLAPERQVPAFRPLYGTLGMLLMLSGPRSRDDLELLRQLADCQLAAGMDAASYLQLVADLEQVLGEDRSVATLAWALDVAEALALHRAPDQAARLRFQVAVLGLAEAAAHRLDPALARAVRLLSRDAGLPVPEAIREAAAQEAAPGSPLARLAGRQVAIYTLAEAAGRRAAELLREMAPGVRVTLRGDLVCTDQLAAAARSADVFVFAWRSSKHQAYYCSRNASA